MTKIKSMKKRFPLVISSIIFSGIFCSTTKVSSTWRDMEYKNGPLNKIIVIGLFKNLTSRNEFENEIVRMINLKTGSKAIPSLNVMSPDIQYKQAKMESLFSNKMNIDGILIVRTKSIDSKAVFVPGRANFDEDLHSTNYYNYYNYTLRKRYEPGYYKEKFIVCTESALFLKSNDKMIWMMETDTFEKYRTEDGITEPKKESKKMAGLIINSLIANNLVKQKGNTIKNK